MARLTRAQQQDRTRATVLAAARAEFAAHGYGEARVDRIAERAELTRGAVYSNFPGKRALYLAVLLDSMEQEDDGSAGPPAGLADALGTFARGWLARLPLTGDTVRRRQAGAALADRGLRRRTGPDCAGAARKPRGAAAGTPLEARDRAGPGWCGSRNWRSPCCTAPATWPSRRPGSATRSTWPSPANT
jgi:AcrR family transcriptional regulator